MSDAWDEIQAIKSKRNSLRERLEKRKKERQDILATTSSNSVVVSSLTPTNAISNPKSGANDDAKPVSNEIFTTVDNGKLRDAFLKQINKKKLQIKKLIFYMHFDQNRIRKLNDCCCKFCRTVGYCCPSTRISSSRKSVRFVSNQFH